MLSPIPHHIGIRHAHEQILKGDLSCYVAFMDGASHTTSLINIDRDTQLTSMAEDHPPGRKWTLHGLHCPSNLRSRTPMTSNFDDWTPR